MTLDEAIAILGETVAPTLEEARNGWTDESLTIYLAERQMAATDNILDPPPVRKTQTVNRMKWMRR